jgi:hypothetical protein
MLGLLNPTRWSAHWRASPTPQLGEEEMVYLAAGRFTFESSRGCHGECGGTLVAVGLSIGERSGSALEDWPIS